MGVKMSQPSRVLVADTCNPGYSGGKDQVPANSSRDHISKKPITIKGWWSASKFRPRVQTPVSQKKLFVRKACDNIFRWL
jgi:hypothetical protein